MEAAALLQHGEAMQHGVLGYLLELVASSLTRGYGGVHAAIDEVTKELAAAVLEAKRDGER